MSDIEQLITNNIPLVYHIIHKDYPWYSHDEDIIQCGMVGLCTAANKFDPTRGSFSTYARKFIHGEICRELDKRKSDKVVQSLDALMEERPSEW